MEIITYCCYLKNSLMSFCLLYYLNVNVNIFLNVNLNININVNANIVVNVNKYLFKNICSLF